MAKILGYSRCSTNEDLQDINRQIRELKQMGVHENNMYFEYKSGAKMDNRPELNKMLNVANEGDTIITTEVSRLSRSTQDLCTIINIVQEKKLKLVIKGSLTIDCTTGELDPMTRAFLQISGVFAELERNIISQRVKSGLENARSKGSVLGRPTATKEDIPTKFLDAYKLYKSGSINKTQIHKLTGISRPTINKYIKLLEE